MDTAISVLAGLLQDEKAPDYQSEAFFVIMRYYRGVAQLVARTAGGREVASSSLVTPTIQEELSTWIALLV